MNERLMRRLGAFAGVIRVPSGQRSDIGSVAHVPVWTLEFSFMANLPWVMGQKIAATPEISKPAAGD